MGTSFDLDLNSNKVFLHKKIPLNGRTKFSQWFDLWKQAPWRIEFTYKSPQIHNKVLSWQATELAELPVQCCFREVWGWVFDCSSTTTEIRAVDFPSVLTCRCGGNAMGWWWTKYGISWYAYMDLEMINQHIDVYYIKSCRLIHQPVAISTI